MSQTIAAIDIGLKHMALAIITNDETKNGMFDDSPLDEETDGKLIKLLGSWNSNVRSKPWKCILWKIGSLVGDVKRPTLSCISKNLYEFLQATQLESCDEVLIEGQRGGRLSQLQFGCLYHCTTLGINARIVQANRKFSNLVDFPKHTTYRERKKWAVSRMASVLLNDKDRSLNISRFWIQHAKLDDLADSALMVLSIGGFLETSP